MDAYDCIVAGSGGVGSAALYHLARRGVRALGIDRFPPGHDRGSSHGETRIIRLAYYEHPDYVPLLRRAYALWEELEASHGETLLARTGLLQVGPPGGTVVSGVLASARRHALDVEELGASEVERRFPGLRLCDGMLGVFERGAGYLRVEACVRAHSEEAVRLGARLAIGETVRSWRRAGAGVVVSTDRAEYTADRLIVSAGPWASDLLGSLGVRLVVLRKPLLWFRCDDPRYDAARGFPCFLFERPDGEFYGFPRVDGVTVKAAEHSGGEVVREPLAVDRTLRPEDRHRVLRFLAECLPGVGPEVSRHTVCLYTLSPDRHFIVDSHPDCRAVVFAAGLSGHGFKFTSVLGEALADLALAGSTALPIQFLSRLRRGLGERSV